MLTVNVTASVPSHGQDWAAANCTQADYPVCIRYTDDPSFEGKLDWTAFDFTTGDFLQTSWLASYMDENQLTYGDGTQECYTLMAVGTDTLQGTCPQDEPPITITVTPNQ